MRIHTLVLTSLLLPLLVVGPARGQTPLAELAAPDLVELKSIGLELSRAGTVTIEAQGLEEDRKDRNDGWRWSWGGDDEDRMTCYAWLIDASTREPVWVMSPRETERGDRGDLRIERVELDLEAGRYELYLYAGFHEFGGDDDNWSWRSERRGRREAEEDLAECYARVTSDDLSGAVRTYEPDGTFSDALIAFTGVGDSELRRQGFELDREMELQLYGLMEYPRGNDEPADFGWIVDLATGERVWDMSDRRGRRAGGSSKNRVLDREVELGPGRYLLTYGTDDSHSAEAFNTDPPFDPLAWGVQIRPGRDFDRGGFRTFDAPERATPLIDFSRARDDDFQEQAFRLSQPTTLHVYAIGEGVDDGWRWVDYGWIIDAATRETVWEMEDRNTVPAGGAEKNRMFDGIVELPAGDYVAFFVTDDSHSWEDWNDAAPFDPAGWGMQISAVRESDASSVSLIDRDDIARATGVLVDLTRMRDDDRERVRFSIDTPTEVEIYAVGEGTRNHMYDHGWIRNLDTRRTVWEMEYRDTDHAGGASKNRMQRDRMTLEPGEYEAVYETDGSHSFGDWNDTRPNDPLSWGMTVRRID